jgi:sulfoquinovosyltransferase
MPSTSETLGFVVLESMASQVPVVAANEGGLKYLIENERTGFLVTPDDDSEFAAWILQLKSDKDLRHRISIAARKEVEDYTWQRSMEEVRFSFYPSAQENFFRRWEQRFLRKLNHMLPVTNQNK